MSKMRMPRSVSASATSGVAARLSAFVLERFPLASTLVRDVLASAGASRIQERDAAHIESFRVAFRQELKRAQRVDVEDILDPTPRVTAESRLEAAAKEIIAACDGFPEREAIAASLTPEERRENRHTLDAAGRTSAHGRGCR